MKAPMEREIEYWAPGASQPVLVHVRIDAPEPHPEYEWECMLTISGFPGQPDYSKKMPGADAMEALSFALAIAPLHLRLMGQRGGRLTWRGNEDLRFPSMFAAPSQDWRFTPSNMGEPRRLRARVGLPERIEDQWSALVTCTDCKTWESSETRVRAATWPEALERAAAAVPLVLQGYADKLGEGTLDEVRSAPTSGDNT